MSAMSGYQPEDLPNDSAFEVEFDNDGTNDPSAVGVSISKWEWRSMQKRKEAEWTVDGTEVRVIQGRDSPGVMFEGGTRDPEVVRIHLTDELMRSLREHGVVSFEATGTFPFDVTVVRRE